MANSTALTGGTRALLDILFQKQIDLSKLKDALNVNSGVNWSFGTIAAQANLLYHGKVTCEDDTPPVDISAAAIKDAFGDACDFAALKFLYIKNNDAAENLEIGGGVADDVLLCQLSGDIILVRPGGFFAWCDPGEAGLDVTAQTDLQLQAETTDVEYELVLLGEKT